MCSRTLLPRKKVFPQGEGTATRRVKQRGLYREVLGEGGGGRYKWNEKSFFVISQLVD